MWRHWLLLPQTGPDVSRMEVTRTRPADRAPTGAAVAVCDALPGAADAPPSAAAGWAATGAGAGAPTASAAVASAQVVAGGIDVAVASCAPSVGCIRGALSMPASYSLLSAYTPEGTGVAPKVAARSAPQHGAPLGRRVGLLAPEPLRAVDHKLA